MSYYSLNLANQRSRKLGVFNRKSEREATPNSNIILINVKEHQFSDNVFFNNMT